MTFPSTRRTRFTAGSSGAWASTRSTRLPAYVRYLQENSQELDLLFKELLIGVTSFFRDRAAWEELRESVIPALLASRPAGQALRAWVPGCSTGEEAYSLAMVFKEAMEKLKPAEEFYAATSLPPTWTRTRLTRPARAFIPRILPPTCRRSG